MTSKFESKHSTNTETSPKNGLETVVIADCILNAPLMFLSILSNALVLVTILRTPSFRSPSVIFLENLAVLDLLVGVVVQPVYIASEIKTNAFLYQALRGKGICWMQCLSVDNDSHNTGSFLTSLSPAVPKFNESKPGNTFINNYMV